MTDITAFPVFGWTTQTFPTGYGLLNISYLPGLPPAGTTQEEAQRAARSLQLGIAAEQAEMLAQDLLALAERLRANRKSAN